jgi:hypothetical protein
MSEHIMEAELGCGKALSSFSKMAGQGEGIYASPTSVDVGIQQTDQNGLTLSPKSKSGDKLSLDACMITDQDFEEALKKLEPLLVETEKRILSFRVDPIYRARRCVAAPAKRRKLSGDQDEPSFHRLCSSPVIWPGSVSFPTRTQQEATEQFLQPTLHTVSTEPVRVCPKNQCYDDGNENPCSEPSVLPVSSTGDRSEEIAACQKNMGNVHLSTNKKIESVKETIPESIAFKSSHHTPNIGREISTAGSDCTVSGKDLKSQGGGVQNVHDLEMSNYGIYHEKSAGVTNPHQGKVFWDPDVPLQSIEKEHQGIGISHHTGMRSSRSRSFDEAVVYGVSVGFPCAFSQTFAGVTKVATNETTRIFEPSQDSLQSSQKSLQTSTLASIARLLLQNSQQALVEDYSKSLSSHQIPAELRQRFRALLRKFQSDEQFQKAVATYTMELTG